ncbi:hypothetical protein [Streptomyces sp. CT34]|uniref:hypothetical protein n=1 Tax=Streptomyces sp. CT34 TaxID=1553907 RepID=UPI0018E35C1D|nr:hypothetical protein [Streptomyces sp. CT34]
MPHPIRPSLCHTPTIHVDVQLLDEDLDVMGETVVRPVQDRAVSIGGGLGLGLVSMPMCGPVPLQNGFTENDLGV